MNLQLTVRTKIWICKGALVTKKGYEPRTNIVKDEKVDLFTDCHSILARGGTISLSC